MSWHFSSPRFLLRARLRKECAQGKGVMRFSSVIGVDSLERAI